jgi:hypothetical protein
MPIRLTSKNGKQAESGTGAMWLKTGHNASRPPEELHGPFKADVGCVALEVSFPTRVV